MERYTTVPPGGKQLPLSTSPADGPTVTPGAGRDGAAAAAGGQHGCVGNGLRGGLRAAAAAAAGAGKGSTAKPAPPAALGEQSAASRGSPSAQRGRGRLVQPRGRSLRSRAAPLVCQAGYKIGGLQVERALWQSCCCELRVNSLREILSLFQKSGQRAFLGRGGTVCLTLVVCLPLSGELPLNLRVKAPMKARLQVRFREISCLC